MPTRRTKTPTKPKSPAELQAPTSAHVALGERLARLIGKWLDLYEATLDDAASARMKEKVPAPIIKLPDVASMKEIVTVVSLCIQIDELASAAERPADEAQSRSDLEAVQRALSETDG